MVQIVESTAEESFGKIISFLYYGEPHRLEEGCRDLSVFLRTSEFLHIILQCLTLFVFLCCRVTNRHSSGALPSYSCT